ncbi:hypothetical protein [Nocardia sp. MDA0666]|uniref:hypothetical protein n=1 Tax=Nocardia sp. MDA0666 TaxID=2135448 RepID=UPI0011B24844|nr:hypothetical protein [Nocardia sp. MDA0666]
MGGGPSENDGRERAVVGSAAARDALSQMQLHTVLSELRDRVEDVISARDQPDNLVEAMLAVTADLLGSCDTSPCSSATYSHRLPQPRLRSARTRTRNCSTPVAGTSKPSAGVAIPCT